MKAARIAQVVLVVLAAVYLWLFHSANPEYVELPFTRLFLPQLPVGFVVAMAVLVGWLIGFLPARVLAWRKGREIRRLQNELAEERRRTAPEPVHVNPYITQSEVPIIPDRAYDPELDDPNEAA